MWALISTIVAVSLVGCATRADEIEAAYVSPLQYESFTCKQIGLEIGRVSTRVHEVTGQQEDTADKDAVVMGVGLILFWPALFFLAGGDHEEELARLKGEYDALESAAIQSDCDIADDLEEARRARGRGGGKTRGGHRGWADLSQRGQIYASVKSEYPIVPWSFFLAENLRR